MMARNLKPLIFTGLVAGLIILPSIAHAAGPSGLDALIATPDGRGSISYTVPVQILIFMTGLVFLPAVLLAMTSFTRIIIVLALLRQALGLTQTPPNQILVALALFLTMFVMAPVFAQVNEAALQPLLNNKISVVDAASRAEPPLKSFMLKQTREDDLGMFVKLAGGETYPRAEDVPMRLVAPAFLTSELRTAFQIGFLIFLPFLVIDIVVAAVMMSLGMMLVSPVTVSLPLKLMVFVLVNGWMLIIGSLAQGFL